MEYSSYDSAYFDDLLRMAIALWKDFPEGELEKILKEIGSSENKQIFFAKDGETITGFVYVSIRHDHVEGAHGSPTGYLEGIYIEANCRKKGVAQELYTLAEKWVVQKGCHQIGSDTWDWNESSIAFHKKIGFQEKDTLVHFIKNIALDT